MNCPITVLIPYKTGSNEAWLKNATDSIPAGIPYLILENDGELAGALNEGLRLADTEYVIRLDADDLLDGPSIQGLLDAVWDADVVYPTWTMVTEDLKLIRTSEPGEFCPNRLLVWNYLPNTALMRREAVLDVGGYRDLEALEDWDLWVRMSRAGKRFKNHPETTYYYRQTEGSRNKAGSEEVQALRWRLKNEIVGDEPPLIASYYSQESIATIYWRCTLPARYLPAQTILHRPQEQLIGDEIQFPYHRGASIWQFPGNEYERYAMAALMECGIPVLIETDDNYTVPSPHQGPWIKDMPDELNAGPSVEMHKRICAWVDGIITTTPFLEKEYRKITDAPIFVCPNQIDPQDWPTVYQRPDWYDPDITYVGFSASASHIPDLKLILSALEWAGKQDGVEVVMMGLHPELASFLTPRLKFRHLPWVTDLNVARHLQGILDIGFAPIIPNRWSNSRSDLKALEYAMAETTPVLSDVVPYKDWTDGERCRKASTARDFLRVTQELIKDPEGRKQLGVDARDHVLAERTMEQNIWRWQEAIQQVGKQEVAA